MRHYFRGLLALIFAVMLVLGIGQQEGIANSDIKFPTKTLYDYDGNEYLIQPIVAENQQLTVNETSISNLELQRVALADELDALLQWCSDNNIELGGVYVDENVNVIQLTYNTVPTISKKLTSVLTDSKNLRVEYVKYSEAELMDIHQKLMEEAEAGNIDLHAVGLNSKLNQVNVYLTEKQLKENKEKLLALAKEDQLHFEVGDFKVVEQAEAVKPGELINYRLNNTSYNCSIGFHGVRSGTDVFVTAGHCSLNLGSIFYKNNVSVGTTVSRFNSTATRIDATAAALGSNGTRSIAVAGTSLTIGTIDINGSRHTNGSYINLSALSGVYTSVKVIDNAYNIADSNTDMILTDLKTTQGGDSGGLYYSTITSTKNGKSYAVVEGIHKGLIVNNQTNVIAGTVLSKMYNMYQDLGLSSVYTDANY